MLKGDRHPSLTGNIWAYAHRGDMTGVKAALVRGVDVNLQNTVGWSAVHAAAAGGHTRVIRALHRAGADMALADRGGNLPAHVAARHGHVQALQVLAELGADISRVRLSQTRGKAVRALIATATRSKQAADGGDGSNDGDEAKPGPVGYARKQAKSTAFFGPRKTPISGKIKRAIQKERRRRQRVAQQSSARPSSGPTNAPDVATVPGAGSGIAGNTEQLLSYAATVQLVKRARKQRLRARVGARQRSQHTGDEATFSDDNAAASAGVCGAGARGVSGDEYDGEVADDSCNCESDGESDGDSGSHHLTEAKGRCAFAVLASSDSGSDGR